MSTLLPWLAEVVVRARRLGWAYLRVKSRRALALIVTIQAPIEPYRVIEPCGGKPKA